MFWLIVLLILILVAIFISVIGSVISSKSEVNCDDFEETSLTKNAFIISLPENQERCASSQAILSNLGISSQKVMAYPIMDSMVTEAERCGLLNRDRDNYGNMSRKELSCALSHYSLIQNLAISDEETITIFEDDITSDISRKELLFSLNNFSRKEFGMGCTLSG